MIDVHTHILPGIDDGSRDMDETCALLREEARQGVRCLAATPHFYANRISVEGFLRRRNDSIRETVAAIWKEEGTFFVPDFFAGAEVYYFPGMGRAEKLPELCFRRVLQVPEADGQEQVRPKGFSLRDASVRTDLLLLEMPFVQWDDGMVRELEHILQRQELRILLAHVERYPEFQKDTRVWERIMNLPVTLQINGGALLRSRKTRKFCLNLLKERDNVVLGSDCHNMNTRKPNLREARDLIARKLGEKRLQLIDDKARALLGL